ncbi:prenyltransferase/squalene oxidase repeat-containing protein [Verrucomicrobiota bacterium]
MRIVYGNRTEDELLDSPLDERIIDARSIIAGLLIFGSAITGASLWHFTHGDDSLKRLKDFEFTPAEPDTEDFELKEPLRELMKEQILDEPEIKEIEETPNIQMTTEITESTLEEEVIKTETIEMTTDVDVDITEMDLIDAPEELTEINDTTVYALTPIAAVVSVPADLFKYKKPNPRFRPQKELINRARTPSLGLKMMPKQFGDLDAPTIGELGPVSINLFGSGEYMSAMGRSGGFETRTAVDSSLRWLALHQEADGHWDCAKWDEEDVTYEEAQAVKGGEKHDTGVTAFALLAFMGGGQTIRKGEYRANIMRGFEYLLKQQDNKTGQLSKNMYEHAIATIALCEGFGRAPDERICLAARKAADFCVKAVAKDHGWRYQPRAAESDMSVASWFLQALKTAKLANIKFDHKAFSRGLAYVDQCTDRGGMKGSTGGVGYQYKPGLQQGAGSRALTCAAMVIRQFSGMGVKSPLLVSAAELTKKSPPDWEKGKDFYHWYYATYAMHNMGGEYRIWWNRRIRDVLLDNQSKRGHQAGSWNPENGKWAQGGRAYTTAMGALCLEVYYRYGEALQSFGTAPDLEELFFQ